MEAWPDIWGSHYSSQPLWFPQCHTSPLPPPPPPAPSLLLVRIGVHRSKNCFPARGPPSHALIATLVVKRRYSTNWRHPHSRLYCVFFPFNPRLHSLSIPLCWVLDCRLLRVKMLTLQSKDAHGGLNNNNHNNKESGFGCLTNQLIDESWQPSLGRM